MGLSYTLMQSHQGLEAVQCNLSGKRPKAPFRYTSLHWFTYEGTMDNERTASPDAPETKSSEPQLAAPRSPRPILLPLVALLLATLVTQLGTLPYIMGRAEQVPGATLQSPLYMVTVVVVSVSVLTIPLAGLGLRLGGRIGLGAPLLTDLLERHPGVRKRLHRDAMVAIPLGLAIGAILASPEGGDDAVLAARAHRSPTPGSLGWTSRVGWRGSCRRDLVSPRSHDAPRVARRSAPRALGDSADRRVASQCLSSAGIRDDALAAAR